MQPKKIRWKSTILPTIGVLLAVIGAIIAISYDDIFSSILSKQLKLTPNSRTYSVWREPNIPIYFDIYFFNWTNPMNFNNEDIKPNFVEMGPYRFRETKEKVNITWNKENSTVSYRHLRRWYFDEEASYGSLDDNITTLNAVAASAVYTARLWGFLRQKAVSVGLSMFKSEVSVTKPVRELLFDGFEDPLLDLAKSLPNMGIDAPPVDKFGWFYQRNGSTENDGYFNMATGADDIKNFGVLKMWNNDSKTSYFSDSCGAIRGSAGELYPPNPPKSHITMFSADLCRTITLDYEKVVNVKGIPAYKFTAGERFLDNGTKYPENQCYCAGECQPSGTLNVSTCRYGAPGFVSFPHFYGADPYYLDGIDGMAPDRKKHEFYIALEPTTAVPVDVAARLQLNFLVSPNSNIALYNNVPKVYIPILWFEQHVVVTNEVASELKFVTKIMMMGNVIGLSIFALGVIIILWSPITVNIKACLRIRRKTKKIPKKSTEESNKVTMNNLRANKTRVNVLPSVQDQDEEEEKDEEQTVTEPLNKVTNDLKNV